MRGVNYINITKIDVDDKNYPQRLLKIKNFPTELYAVGNMELLNSEHSVGIVGTRDCTDYGRKVTKEFAKEISREKICIISGMALGIDGIAHDIAVMEKGKTIAVLGGGFNHIYPKENEWLFYKILEYNGCIISEYSPETEVTKSNFPIRNRIISGLSDAILVVEAKFRSGSSITAKYAQLQGKNVYAIPNSIYENTGIGTNILIQQGAELITKPKQIIEKIKPSTKRNRKNEKNKNLKEINKRIGKETDKSKINSTSESENSIIKNKADYSEENFIDKATKENIPVIIKKEYLEIYKLLSNIPMHLNEIAIRLNKSIQEITPIIILMEIDGFINQIDSNYYIRKADEII